MKRTRGHVVHIDSLADFDSRLGRGARRLSGWRVRGLDLSDRTDQLRNSRVSGATFIGCTFADSVADLLVSRGAIVVASRSAAPVDVDRTTLYSAQELFTPGVGAYAESPDARAYAWSQRPADSANARIQALHDLAIDQALHRWVEDRTVVGVMGGHAAQRGEPTYADAARLGRLLGARLTVATGGGPGAMEAANLGARLAREPESTLVEALARLSAVPSYRPSIQAWADSAFAVCQSTPTAAETLGIPTWHYGHEPPNVFATAIAKYFRNATREAILLEVCNAGIVFLPGAAGTVQEVFQDACENYYADEASVAPMVLVGRTHWTETLPAWPLVQALARGRAMEEHVHLVDTVEEAAAVVSS